MTCENILTKYKPVAKKPNHNTTATTMFHPVSVTAFSYAGLLDLSQLTLGERQGPVHHRARNKQMHSHPHLWATWSHQWRDMASLYGTMGNYGRKPEQLRLRLGNEPKNTAPPKISLCFILSLFIHFAHHSL